MQQLESRVSNLMQAMESRIHEGHLQGLPHGVQGLGILRMKKSGLD